MAFLRPGYRDQKSQHGKLFACATPIHTAGLAEPLLSTF
jgi:hypothetical protein